MNVDKWREALSVNNLLPQYSDVIDGFTHGFDQGIPQHAIDGKPWFTPENHKSSLLVRDKIEETLQTLGIRSEASEQPLGPRFSLGTASRPPVNPPNPPSTSERLQDRPPSDGPRRRRRPLTTFLASQKHLEAPRTLQRNSEAPDGTRRAPERAATSRRTPRLTERS
ncbi:hypothetical protein PGT21_022417 [Puccinia graminis f. sp. tritici]|uniref:Uncharacterized protein n=1 Tax=Puccinia graminis f. sp. tritici TaxID=56615 RepID=A0A5B0QTV6_PUCGR|nr:hypothetical protein PGT21_022417 [Puccinia graminis f. sp. tritici]